MLTWILFRATTASVISMVARSINCTDVKRTPLNSESARKNWCGKRNSLVDVDTDITMNIMKGREREKYPRLTALIIDAFKIIQISDLH